MPCIKACCFGFEFENEAGVITTFSFKKWKDVRMNVEDFEHCKIQVLDCFSAELCLDQVSAACREGGKTKESMFFLIIIQLAAMTIIITIYESIYEIKIDAAALCTHKEELK